VIVIRFDPSQYHRFIKERNNMNSFYIIYLNFKPNQNYSGKEG